MYTAMPCPVLSAPTNGSISCPKGQVTNETCTYSCDLGYYLDGPGTRLCLNSTVWIGEESYCLPLLCEELELEAELTSHLLLPCYNEYTSVCLYLCADGYYLDDTGTYERTCLVTSQTTVDWSPAEVCESEYGIFVHEEIKVSRLFSLFSL